MIESIEKPQESIRKNRNPHRVIPAQAGIQKQQRGRTLIGKNRNPHRVIPAQAGIQKRNATGIYRKKQKPHRRHSRKSGNLETQRGRTLSEKTETPTAVIPAKAGIQTRRHGNLPDKTVSLDSTS
ncbi:hypothetical protein [Neisseria meningitidis]|uniref:hypothetical protein n=1 Tax=Neisseria meningitidis TaxID=487 RepID=UPI001E2AB27A|nr:hypothetical protein [Neisseria meningitidis]